MVAPGEMKSPTLAKSCLHPAVERRADLGAFEIELAFVDRRFGGSKVSERGVHLRLLQGQIRRVALKAQIFPVPLREIGFRARPRKRFAGASDLAAASVDRKAILRRVDPGEDVALLDCGAGFERRRDLDDLACNLRRDVRFVLRFHLALRRDAQGRLFSARGRDFDRDRQRRLGALLGLRRGRQHHHEPADGADDDQEGRSENDGLARKAAAGFPAGQFNHARFGPHVHGALYFLRVTFCRSTRTVFAQPDL